MDPFNEKTVKLLSRSGLFLLFLSMAGSFAMATLSISARVEEQSWNELFGMLFLAVLGISVYYIALGGFSWVVLRKKKAESPVA
jgi:hypothetical protein